MSRGRKNRVDGMIDWPDLQEGSSRGVRPFSNHMSWSLMISEDTPAFSGGNLLFLRSARGQVLRSQVHAATLSGFASGEFLLLSGSKGRVFPFPSPPLRACPEQREGTAPAQLRACPERGEGRGIPPLPQCRSGKRGLLKAVDTRSIFGVKSKRFEGSPIFLSIGLN
jgi:hypothetical protein